jgi:hypothetical protein
MPSVEAAVKEIVGTSGDADVLNYVISILDDESFEFGDDAEEAFEAIGHLLVRPLSLFIFLSLLILFKSSTRISLLLYYIIVITGLYSFISPGR